MWAAGAQARAPVLLGVTAPSAAKAGAFGGGIGPAEALPLFSDLCGPSRRTDLDLAPRTAT